MQEIADKIFLNTTYQGVNVAAILTRIGFICIDAPSYPRDARDWVSKLNQIDPRPIRFVILTDGNGDRVLNIRWLNARIICHGLTANLLSQYEKRYPTAWLESLSNRNPEMGRTLTNSPVEHAAMSFEDEMTLLQGGVEIELIHLPGANAGNIAVHIPKADVIFTGDCVTDNTHPFLQDSSIQKWLGSLNRLQNKPFTTKTLVPGRGHHANLTAITKIESYLQDMQTKVEELVEQDQPISDTHELIREFKQRYPLGYLPSEWLQTKIQANLEQIYNELTPISENLSEELVLT